MIMTGPWDLANIKAAAPNMKFGYAAVPGAAVPEDAEMESFLPFVDIASARHELADLRLFAN